MNFNPIELNGLTTFIGTFKVSDESVNQCVSIFKAMSPKPGVTGTGVNKKKKDSLDLAIVPNYTVSIQK